MIKRHIKIFIFICIGMFLSGCLPITEAIFINSSKTNFKIALVNAGSGVTKAEFQLDAGGFYKTEIGYDNAIVTDLSGRKVFEQILPGLDQGHKYIKLSKLTNTATIYFLVTEQGIYPIPWEYRDSWKDHLNEIISVQN